jgi:CheY-like chemotaxis protein
LQAKGGERVHTEFGGGSFMSQETRSRRVVIAEDNDDMRAVIRELIESLGAEVVEAASGGDLIMLLTDEKPVDLLITDVRMPWMTGFQVSLAARNAGLTMPIIVVTAFGDDHLRAQVERLGSASLLSKPFRPEELLSLARSLLPS